MNEALSPGDTVRHAKFGLGWVEYASGPRVFVRFEHDTEVCEDANLRRVCTPAQAVEAGAWSTPVDVITRAQAEAIRSVNDMWGVFARSRIALLPHQLWVCKKVTERLPARWLVADDVGLGKTVEAGLILSPLLSRGHVRRVLVVCPASLVDQWHDRLYTMFDIRLMPYQTDADTRTANFWAMQDQVVASLQTLRARNPERMRRFYEADPWDVLIVDEAHHLNADEKSGATLGYELVREMVDRNHADSVVFFTGTPHRGKDYGFLSLLRLLRPETFHPDRPMRDQLPHLRDVMIRNNKHTVTDMHGNRLFHEPDVASEKYSHSDAEAGFYSTLTEFITTGKAYASSLDATSQNAVILVLISMQKLASSSVAAIRSALKRRLENVTEHTQQLRTAREAFSTYEQLERDQEEDALNDLIETRLLWEARLRLMADEADRLRELIVAAAAVGEETKIRAIVRLLRERFADRSVLLFTEYKATQSLVMSAIMHEFGDDSVTFINGDNTARDVVGSGGVARAIHEGRRSATRRFTSGEVRFLVSTEAGGEGIDLQANCHTLINVDLPWNPMRLHQRVGRLNRYGQKERVDVVNFVNPDTVESRIWDKLNEYIGRIMVMQGHAMDEPEDLLELILGMTSPSVYRELFADGHAVPRESLDAWVDERLGRTDALDTVLDLVGNSARFDFSTVSSDMPQVDLPDLRPFFRAMLKLNRRNAPESEGGLSFKTPTAWLTSPATQTDYSDMTFERGVDPNTGTDRLLGVGHRAMDSAIEQAKSSDAVCAVAPASALSGPLVVCRISDGTTEGKGATRSVVVGVDCGDGTDGVATALRDWQLLGRLNRVLEAVGVGAGTQVREERADLSVDDVLSAVARAEHVVEADIPRMDLPYSHPQIDVLALLWPDG
jgi:superfamily II DNA or RNA helicase